MVKILSIFLVLVLLFMPSPIKSQSVPPPFSHELIMRQAKRAKRSDIDKLMEILQVKQGMTILDIGTGSGQYAYKFAEKMKGTGKVFATDIDSDMISYVKKEASKKDFVNLYPVLVKNKGVDKFYGKHKYDLIFLAYVYPYLKDRVNYFKKMGNFLAKDGRFVVVGYKDYSFFTLDDFIDFEGLAGELSREPVDSPFYKYLVEPTRKLINQKIINKADEFLKDAIVGDFNKLLVNPHFCSDFLKDGLISKEELSFSSEEEITVNYLVRFLQTELGVFDPEGAFLGNLDSKDTALIKMLNRLLIVRRFRRYLRKDEQFPRGDSPWEMEVKRTLEEAGCKLKNEYNFQPFEVILVFISSKNTNRR